MVEESCKIKRQVVEADPTEKGERALLNFGHTVGHAIEKLKKFLHASWSVCGVGMSGGCPHFPGQGLPFRQGGGADPFRLPGIWPSCFPQWTERPGYSLCNQA